MLRKIELSTVHLDIDTNQATEMNILCQSLSLSAFALQMKGIGTYRWPDGSTYQGTFYLLRSCYCVVSMIMKISVGIFV
jgi:hypothetical protein